MYVILMTIVPCSLLSPWPGILFSIPVTTLFVVEKDNRAGTIQQVKTFIVCLPMQGGTIIIY